MIYNERAKLLAKFLREIATLIEGDEQIEIPEDCIAKLYWKSESLNKKLFPITKLSAEFNFKMPAE